MSYFFYRGFVVKILLPQPNGSLLVHVVENRLLNPDHRVIGTEFIVSHSNLEPLCEDVLPIGFQVESTLRQVDSFTGTVVGYELHSNRVVCISAKIDMYDNDRTRWAYKVNELRHFNPVPSMAAIFGINTKHATITVGGTHEENKRHESRRDIRYPSAGKKWRNSQNQTTR